MTDGDRARIAVDTAVIAGMSFGAGGWAMESTFREHLRLAFAEVRAEERSEAARIVREVARRPRTDPDVVRAACAAFDEAEAAIRARGTA